MNKPVVRTRTAKLKASGGGLISRSQLPDGLRVITEAMPAVRSVSVGVWVPVGSRHESTSVAGASHFLEHLLFKGTGRRTGLEIARTMDAIGGEFNAFTEKEHTCYYATVLDRDIDIAIDIITDVVLDAKIRSSDFEVERDVVLEEISMRDDDPSDLVHDEFSSALFGDTPIGRPILGTAESINAMTRTQVAGYYRRRYRPEDMVVSAAGNLTHAEVLNKVRAGFDRHTRGVATPAGHPGAAAVRPAHIPPMSAPRSLRVIGDDTEQANIVLGMRSYSRHDPRRFAGGVFSAVLGGGMSSRLFQAIREDRGLAYSVYSFGSTFADIGQFGVYSGSQPAKAFEVVEIIQRELADVASNGVSDDEVERGKGQMRGGIVLGLEDPGSRMTRIGKSELCYGDVLGVDQLLQRIDAVTPRDVRSIAAELLEQPRCLTVVGPFEEKDFAGVA